jgi:hypothetical protein
MIHIVEEVKLLLSHDVGFNLSTLRRRIKTHIIRYHTRNRMQTPQIKLLLLLGNRQCEDVTVCRSADDWVMYAKERRSYY